FSRASSHSLCPVLSPLSLHDALPISLEPLARARPGLAVVRGDADLLADAPRARAPRHAAPDHDRPRVVHAAGVEGEKISIPPNQDRKSTRLNSSHQIISYAVFCLKKK